MNTLVLLMAAVGAVGASLDADAVWYAGKVRANETGSFAPSRVHVLRLGPDEDLHRSIYRYA